MAWVGLVLGFVLAGGTIAHGAPGDPFAVALPGRDTQPSEALPSTAGESSVSETQGSASYAFPIDVPPGRRGMAPALALSYSSSGALRGGIAAGWSLELPSIERDPDAPSTSNRYRLSMGEVSGVLIAVAGDPGAGYRVEIDDQFARVARSGTTWTVATPDGITRTFDLSGSDGSTRWNLTAEKDAFGNEVRYLWNKYTLSGYTEQVLDEIHYTFNTAAGLGAHAKVELQWKGVEYCPGSVIPKGAQTDHRFGVKRMRGMQQLEAISSWVLEAGTWRKAQQVTLSYDAAAAACTGGAPLRLLKQIDVTAWNQSNQAVTRPPVRFGYGPLQPDFSRTTLGFGGLEVGTDEGPERTRMDIDGDGIADLVSVRMPEPTDPNQRCRLTWRKGLSGGFIDVHEHTAYLPTALWGRGEPMVNDSCTLNGQYSIQFTDSYWDDGQRCTDASAVQVAYHFMDWDGDGDPDLVTGVHSTGNTTACGDFDGPCYRETRNRGGEKPCASGDVSYQDDQGAWHCYCGTGEDWDAAWESCHVDCQDGEQYNGSVCVPGCSSFEDCSGGGFDPLTPPNTSGPGSSCPVVTPQPETDLQPVWRVFLNDPLRPGGQRFDPEDGIRFTAPQALPLNGGPLAPPQDGPAHLPRLADMDGDGWQDLIVPTVGSLNNATAISFHRGQASGFAASASSIALQQPAWSPDGDRSLRASSAAPVYTEDGLAFTDLNGDGLPDILARQSTDGKLYVRYNHGTYFASPIYLGVTSPVHKSRIEFDGVWHDRGPLTAGWRAEQRRVVDLDDDGLPELLVLEGVNTSLASTRQLHRLHVDGRIAIDTAPSSYEPFERLTRAINSKAWYRASDVVDVTGDGLPDLVTAGAQGSLDIRTAALDAAPMRLLTSIDNGRGAVTTFEYARSTAAGMVELRPGEAVAPRWLVRRVRVNPGANQPEMTTRYAYAYPVRGQRSTSDLRPASFLGFGKVTTWRSGQQGEDSVRTTTELTYNTGADRRAHPVRVTTSLPAAGGEWRDVNRVETTWTYRSLFGGAVGFSFDERTVTTVPGDGTSADQVVTVERTQSPFVWSGKTLLYLPTEEREWEGAIGFFSRSLVRGYQTRVGQSPYAATDYRVIPVSEERRQLVMGYPTTLARTETDLDAKGLPYQTRVATGISTMPTATTARTFDQATGLVLTEKRPNQVALASPKVTTFTYDASKVHVQRVVNELNQAVDEYRDAATGALIRRTGPNVRYLKAPGCTSTIFFICPTLPYPEVEEWSVDGFGRVVQHRVATDAATGHYALTLAGVVAYVESTIPNRVTTQALRDFGGSVWVTTDRYSDGLGRAVSTVERNQQAGRPDAVSDHSYDAGGGLLSVRVPDPRPLVDSTAQVVYLYERDGLGRVTRFVRPDGHEDRVVYGTGSATTTSWSPLEGQGATTQVRHDGFGRMVEVHEHDNPEPGQIAVTRYGYDPLDRINSIQDADGNLTTLAYDWRGLRTSVTRGSRTWSYTYDRDGNLTENRSPVPAGASAAHYTSIATYDELGRVRVYTPATRGMSTNRLAQLGIGAITTSYDSGNNAVGKVSSVAQSGLFSISYAYDVRGHVKREQRTVTLSNAIHGASLSSTQWVDRTYNALGAPVEAVWDDGTRWRYGYDERSQVKTTDWLDPQSNTYRTLATYSRGVDGRPRERLSAWDQRRRWTYDAIGRVQSDRVYANSTNVSWAERNYGYDGFGRLEVTGGMVNGVSTDSTFSYDQRDRVVGAEGPAAYEAAFSYTPGGNVRTAHVQGAIDTPDRNAEYRYGDVDPQAVDRLTDLDSGEVIASLIYDAAGNVTSRATGGASTQLVWGGDQQLREVNNGTNVLERYYYAGAAQRILAVGADDVRLWFGESETRFTTSGAQQKRWFHIATGEPIARVERVGSNPATTTIELQYADALQNLMIALTPAGVVTSSFVYGAFGEVVSQSGAAAHRRQFNGKEADVASGLRFYGYRYYDPMLLRWTAADPLFRFAPEIASTSPQYANLYAFSLNNPLTYMDPDGRCPSGTGSWNRETCADLHDQGKKLECKDCSLGKIPFLKTAVLGAASMVPALRVAVFVYEMSQAANENEIVAPMLGFALGASSIDDAAGVADDVATVADDVVAGSVAARDVAGGVVDISTVGRTTDEVRSITEYARRANEWLAEAGPQTVQSTKGQLRKDASAAARRERARAKKAGQPYRGQAGHVPDTAVTGMAVPPAGWLDMAGASNQVCGGVISCMVGLQIVRYTVDGHAP